MEQQATNQGPSLMDVLTAPLNPQGLTIGVENSPEIQAKMSAYIKALGSTTGNLPSDEQISTWSKTVKTMPEMSQVFFAWVNNAKQEITFTPEHEQLFRYALSLQETQAYRELVNSINTCLAQAGRLQRDANQQLEAAASYRGRLMAMDKTREIDMLKEIQSIVADGWYRFEAEHTDKHNKDYGQTNDLCIIFSTPPIMTKHENSDAKINYSVDMGRYKVKYYPKRNKIQVVSFSMTMDIDGYVHPHISGNGDVCWGNAADLYNQCMNLATPKAAFDALRIILTNYNDQSPYVDLTRYLARRNPEQYKTVTGLDTQASEYEPIGEISYRYDILNEYSGIRGIGETEESDEDNDGFAYIETYRRRVGDELQEEYYIRVFRAGVSRYVEVDSWVN